VAVEYDGGVVIGADSRTTTGYVSFFSTNKAVKLFVFSLQGLIQFNSLLTDTHSVS
jgi:20S proteasome alpha/beta subunit